MPKGTARHRIASSKFDGNLIVELLIIQNLCKFIALSINQRKKMMKIPLRQIIFLNSLSVYADTFSWIKQNLGASQKKLLCRITQKRVENSPVFFVSQFATIFSMENFTLIGSLCRQQILRVFFMEFQSLSWTKKQTSHR